MTANILIVEDEGLVGLELSYLLEDLGHHVVGVAACSAEALELARTSLDVALVDVNLADGPTGKRVGRELAARGVSVIFTTANPGLLDDVGAAVGVLPKPYTHQSMAEVVAYALDRRQGGSRRSPARLNLFRQPEHARLSA